MEYGRIHSSEKKTMSVPEMRKLLGLGKTESYWLIHKNYFKTAYVCKTYRVYIDSFEEWYAGQWRYWKINGPAPGSKYPKYISKREIMETLNISLGSADYIIYTKPKLKTHKFNDLTCVLRSDFEKWYESQHYYKKVK